mmetsp:Transcript_22046/g.65283  ORF Transcript_22046/g.65283 Transcript_22046/m.65283 type:complete len:322 (+) Transcript_22046:1386-2351(+)
MHLRIRSRGTRREELDPVQMLPRPSIIGHGMDETSLDRHARRRYHPHGVGELTTHGGVEQMQIEPAQHHSVSPPDDGRAGDYDVRRVAGVYPVRLGVVRRPQRIIIVAGAGGGGGWIDQNVVQSNGRRTQYVRRVVLSRTSGMRPVDQNRTYRDAGARDGYDPDVGQYRRAPVVVVVVASAPLPEKGDPSRTRSSAAAAAHVLHPRRVKLGRILGRRIDSHPFAVMSRREIYDDLLPALMMTSPRLLQCAGGRPPRRGRRHSIARFVVAGRREVIVVLRRLLRRDLRRRWIILVGGGTGTFPRGVYAFLPVEDGGRDDGSG